MTLFQWILLVVLALTLVSCFIAVYRGAIRKTVALFVTIVWAGTSISVVWPELTSKVARIVGIGRGTDLILYCAVVVMLVGFFLMYVRLCRIRREITLLVRHLALRTAEGPETSS